MARKNKLLEAPPFAVEDALVKLGANIRTARLRRNITIAEVADRIGTGPRAVRDAENGKPSSSIATYAALLWVFGLLEQLADVANPDHDEEGQILAQFSLRQRARYKKDLDNDF